MVQAVAAGVKHIIFSHVPPCTEMMCGKVSMKAMDSDYRAHREVLGCDKSTTLEGGC